jgi:hypothetical protein
MGTGIVQFIWMETRDGQRYCGGYCNGDTRWAQVLWSLLEWRHEMGTGIVELTVMETGDGHRYCRVYCDGNTKWSQSQIYLMNHYLRIHLTVSVSLFLFSTSFQRPLHIPCIIVPPNSYIGSMLNLSCE